MIYLELLLGFLLVGCFSFGGAYGAIPLIKEVVMTYGWVSEDMFAYFVAVSESTPGPIMVYLCLVKRIFAIEDGDLFDSVKMFFHINQKKHTQNREYHRNKHSNFKTNLLWCQCQRNSHVVCPFCK